MGWDKQMGGIPLGFLPSDLPGLKAWHKFNFGITETGLGVSQWDDASGNGNHQKQGTDLDRPQKQGDGSILYDGIRQFTKADAFTLVQPETVYILFKQVTWVSNDRIYDGEANTSMAFLQDKNGGGGSSPNVVMFAGAYGPDSLTGVPLDTYAVVGNVFNGASSVMQVNDTSTTGNTGSSDAGGFTLGARGDGAASFSNIQVKECLVFSTAHDAATRAKVIAYLSNVGGL